MPELRRTPLFARHREAGAKFVDFGGWQMPVQYRGLLLEHGAVRSAAGVFDVSHMGEIEVEGHEALHLCQTLTTNDAARLAVGQAQYTLWCAEDGGTIDDTILYRRGEQRFLFCVNAANTDACREWIGRHAAGVDAEVRDLSPEMALLAVQGPRAAEVVRRMGAAWLGELPRFGCADGELGGVRLFGARTGYTGEDGFELFCSAADAVELWDRVGAAGAPLGLEPVGLGARDTLRLEAGLALYGHELARDITPLEAGLAWAVKFDKGEFLGRSALVSQHERGLARRLVGLVLVDKGIARAGYPVLAAGTRVGRVTSGTRSPTLGRSVALALVDEEWVDADLSIEIRGRAAAAERVKPPFYRRPAPGRDGK